MSGVPYVKEEYTNFITFNPITQMYTVWDETQAHIVGETSYPKVAEAMIDAYCKYYLGE